MSEFLSFAGDFWWLVFPLSGVVVFWGHSWSEASERRHKRRMEMYSLKNYGHVHAPERRPDDDALAGAPAPQTAQEIAQEIAAKRERDVAQVTRRHDEVDGRWLTYELDAAKLIDYPMMTDVREPLTVSFLRAKREADALRPESSSPVTAEELADYRAAVTSYDVAFQVAETEARRLRASGFTSEERRRLESARKLVTLAVDDAATAAERQTAYRRARRELDGLIVLPDATLASLEEKVAGALGGRPEPRPS